MTAQDWESLAIELQVMLHFADIGMCHPLDILGSKVHGTEEAEEVELLYGAQAIISEAVRRLSKALNAEATE